jgi:hypothetical protein
VFRGVKCSLVQSVPQPPMGLGGLRVPNTDQSEALFFLFLKAKRV